MLPCIVSFFFLSNTVVYNRFSLSRGCKIHFCCKLAPHIQTFTATTETVIVKNAFLNTFYCFMTYFNICATDPEYINSEEEIQCIFDDI